MTEARYRCSKCGEHRSIEEMARNKNRLDGIDCWCRPCHRKSSRRYAEANPAKVAASQRAYRASTERRPSTRDNRKVNLKARFDMTPEQYDELLTAQGGGCAICGEHRVERGRHNMHVDHDYTTGAVRGILCGTCNRGVGMFADSPERLEAAATYLRVRSDRPTQYSLRQNTEDRRRRGVR